MNPSFKNRAFSFGALAVVPFLVSGFAFASNDDSGDDDSGGDDASTEVHSEAVSLFHRPLTEPAPQAKGKIKVENESLSHQKIEFEVEHLLSGHTYSLFIANAPGSSTYVSLGDFSNGPGAEDEQGDDDAGGDDDSGGDDDGAGGVDDDGEAKMKFKTGALPLGVTDVAALSGCAVQVRDEGDVVYLEGSVPTLVGDFSPDKTQASLLPSVGGKGKLRLASTPKKGKEDLQLKLAGLKNHQTVTFGVEHPSTHNITTFATIQLKKSGNGALHLQTKKGDPLPFGLSLKQLGGLHIEVCDPSTSQVLMTGVIPQL